MRALIPGAGRSGPERRRPDRRFRAIALLVALGASPGFVAPPASADVTARFTVKDGQVLGRTMGYVGDGRTGEMVVGVVFAPDQTPSREEARAIAGVLGESFAAGRVRLRAVLVPLGGLSETSGLDALYVTAGVAGSQEVLAAAQRMHVPTVSAGMACVETAHCAIGFRSEPTVQIVISRSAADRAGVRFMPAFRMLVTER